MKNKELQISGLNLDTSFCQP